MITHELTYRSGRDADSWWVTMYRQDGWRWLRAQAYHRWEHATGPLMQRIEKVFIRRHYRSCQDDCQVGVDVNGQPVAICGYIPLSNRQDLRCHDLISAGRTQICECEVTRDDAVEMGWPE